MKLQVGAIMAALAGAMIPGARTAKHAGVRTQATLPVRMLSAGRPGDPQHTARVSGRPPVGWRRVQGRARHEERMRRQVRNRREGKKGGKQ